MPAGSCSVWQPVSPFPWLILSSMVGKGWCNRSCLLTKGRIGFFDSNKNGAYTCILPLELDYFEEQALSGTIVTSSDDITYFTSGQRPPATTASESIESASKTRCFADIDPLARFSYALSRTSLPDLTGPTLVNPLNQNDSNHFLTDEDISAPHSRLVLSMRSNLKPILPENYEAIRTHHPVQPHIVFSDEKYPLDPAKRFRPLCFDHRPLTSTPPPRSRLPLTPSLKPCLKKSGRGHLPRRSFRAPSMSANVEVVEKAQLATKHRIPGVLFICPEPLKDTSQHQDSTASRPHFKEFMDVQTGNEAIYLSPSTQEQIPRISLRTHATANSRSTGSIIDSSR